MSGYLLTPSESVRLCFRSHLPGYWTLGEEVALCIAIENEAGVRVRHPHGHHVWTEPESDFAREGLAKGVPLRVALEGQRAGRFLLDVTSCIATGDDGGGGAGGKIGGNGGVSWDGDKIANEGLILNLTTGTAKGAVTILPAVPTGKSRALPHQQKVEPPSFCSSAESVRRCWCRRRRRRRRRGRVQEVRDGVGSGERQGEDLDEEGQGEGRLHLLISVSPAWAKRFNRPVLPLESLPAPVLRPPSFSSATTLPAPAPARARASAPPDIHESEEGQNRATNRNGSCSVRRLRFEVHNAEESGGKGERGRQGGGEKSTPVFITPITTTDTAGVPAGEDDPGVGIGTLETRKREQNCGAKPSSSGEEILGTTTTTTCGIFKRRDMAVVEVCAVESISLGGFFGTVWDCSLKMGAFLTTLGPEALRGKRVVELGAGCGAVSTLCSVLGAAEVVATDMKDLLPLLTFNLEMNQCQGFVNVKACEYNWGSPIYGHPELARGNFDVIICSDVLYDPAGWEPLLESLRLLTARGGGRQQRRQHRAAAAPSSVVYLAQRTRNMQELEFFAKVVEVGRAGVGVGSVGVGDLEGPSSGGGGERGSEERLDTAEVLSFRCRKLLEGGGRHQEKWVDVSSEEKRREVAEAGDSSSALRNAAVAAERGGGELLWRRGCFPDIALYELSTTGAGSSGISNQDL